MSSRDEQHTAAGYFCVKRNFGYKRGLSTARAEDPDIWPEVTSGSLWRVLHLHGEKFKNVPEFHLSTVKRSDGRSILTQLEMEDVAASMFEAARAGYPFTNLDKNVAIIDILKWRQKKNRAGGRAFVKLSEAANAVLNKGKINGRWFWRKFYAQFPMLKVKPVKETSVDNVLRRSLQITSKP